VALLRAQKALDNLKVANEDEKMGVEIIKRALEDPLRQIAINAGVDGNVVLEEVKKRGDNEGFNALTGEFVDMFKAGIIDPAKVTRSALENASSVSGMILTTRAIVYEIPEKKEAKMSPEAMGGLEGMDMPDEY